MFTTFPETDIVYSLTHFLTKLLGVSIVLVLCYFLPKCCLYLNRAHSSTQIHKNQITLSNCLEIIHYVRFNRMYAFTKYLKLKKVLTTIPHFHTFQCYWQKAANDFGFSNTPCGMLIRFSKK